MMYLIWGGFLLFILLMLMLDLGVFHRQARVMRVREALTWTGVWVALALVFNVFVYYLYENGLADWSDASGKTAAIEYFTGYLLEKSLSVDNIFVIALIFAAFRIPLAEQHRVLVWGILGAVVLRGVMIGIGATLMREFDWIVYVFGGLLIVSAVKMLLTKEESIDPERNLAVRVTRRLYPVSRELDGSHFFTTVDGKNAVTPLFLALILVETSDVMFAVDSIPAIFAVTQDPFLVFTSNVFAILGLRSLYFALAGLMDKFRYLKLSLVFVLAYVGVKMMLSHTEMKIDNLVSLAIIGGILAVGVIASLVAAADDDDSSQDSEEDDSNESGEADAVRESIESEEPA